ncbi:hypothetical protein NC653_039868 [Populus alba x Populus x berolinensis]|uniref:Uncharacterized protein n=1 Tax=Populus alba x Populus x berolinensis TaxID=444605 RepID=A0AAD6LCA6_9ROSI|nr:hypothetical protein NC653_039868 [Populus alba x Populus x berolinensis]
MHIVSSCPPPSPSISKNVASSILKNLYVPKKSNENKKEEAATRCSLSHHHCHTTSQPSSSGLSLHTPSRFFPYFSFFPFSEIPLNQFTQHTNIFLIQSWKNPIFHFYLFIHQGFFYELPNEESVLYAFKSDKSVSIDVL